MHEFIARFDPPPGDGPTVAIKDCIDVAGMITTGGSPAVADRAEPAAIDAACVAAVRAAGGRIVGKANLHELCFGATGVNPWYGTPTNPLDSARIPGGSSSGSAVSVAIGAADIALGTDTTGSVRTPAAYCGVAGLKTTWGRIPLAGVMPLAPSLDTVGVLAQNVSGLARGMALLEPGLAISGSPVLHRIGRIRPGGVAPAIDAALDAALARLGIDIVEVTLPGWAEATAAGRTVLLGEAWAALGHLWRGSPDRIGAEVAARFRAAAAVTPGALEDARACRPRWQSSLAAVFADVDVLALPTCPDVAPLLRDRDPSPNPLATAVSLAGSPALALPIPLADSDLPASVQLVGASGSESELLAIGAAVEVVIGAGPFALGRQER